MSCMKSDVVKEASVDIVMPERIISDQVIVKVIFFFWPRSCFNGLIVGYLTSSGSTISWTEKKNLI